MERRLLPNRYGGYARATFDLVAPLAHKATATCITENAGHPPMPGCSGTVSRLIGSHLRPGDLTSANQRSTRRTPTINVARQRIRQLDAARIFEPANSYFGLLRQTTHSHSDRIRLARDLYQRGLAVNGKLTKVYRP